MRKYILVITIFFIGFMLQGCDSPKLEPIGNGTILAFGDSLTLGVGTTKENSYPTVLSELTGLKVINSGVSGETTDRGLKRLSAELDNITPDLIILIEGGNDILRNKRQSGIKHNLKMMIELAKSQGIQVILIGVPKKSLFLNSAPFYEELAESYNLVFDDNLIADLLRNPSLKSDSIHLNKQGYRKMAENIYQLLSDNGAL